MQLVEKHIIKNTHSFYNECDSLCFLSKNLYNSILFNVRQHYFNNKTYLNLSNSYKLIKENIDYKQLPAKVGNQTLKLVDKNFKSFFSLLKKKNGGEYDRKVKIPKYLDKVKGRFITKYEKGALSVKEFKKTGRIKLSKTNINISTGIKDFESINEVRIIPRNLYYVIEVVYTVPDVKLKEDNGKYCAIDLGVNNLATMTFNTGDTPEIINGKPLKSINQYYNKKTSEYKSKLEKVNKKHTSKRLSKLSFKRNNKVNDYLHKASKLIVNQLVSKGVHTLIVGQNKEWKQDINNGRKNNQNFVQIPHYKFTQMLEYKCRLVGINVILQEESYTSKASFLSQDFIPTYGKGDKGEHKFSGYRIHRGLYKEKGDRIYINADVNGSYNILRKAIPNAFVNGIEGLSVNPLIINV